MVKRYAMTEYPHECCMEQDDAGQYVLHDDYAALQAENDRLKAGRVDLEQFRDLVGFACMRAINLPETDPRRDYIRQCVALLALIDAHKGE